MREVYIIDAIRTPLGRFNGTLVNVSAVKLAEILIRELIDRNHVNKDDIDEVLVGNVLGAGLGQNIARQALIGSGIDESKTACTINMVCGSGMRSVAMAAQEIMCGDAELVLAGGTENMSMTPYLLMKARNGYRMGNGELVDYMVNDGLWDVFNNYHMGVTAENLAEKFGISREEQDEYATLSQNRAEKAMESRRFEKEIVPVSVPQRKGEAIRFAVDEFPRKGVTVESLSSLAPAFKENGTVTAGNASGINDGAAMLLIASEKAVEALGRRPMARIVSYAWHGVSPAYMGLGPVEATRKCLARAEWKLEDLDLIEANEAFAAQMLTVEKKLSWDRGIVNVNGGAIALGHPIGASGARILVTLLHEMEKRDVSKGHATMCIGGGMGIAMCVQRSH
jgi:acetyl-CoA C-acetyltransferase